MKMKINREVAFSSTANFDRSGRVHRWWIFCLLWPAAGIPMAIYSDWRKPVEAIPLWMKSSRCLTENDAESREDELAVAVFRTFRGRSVMKNAAFGYFGELRIRKEADGFLILCPNTALHDEFAKLSVTGHLLESVGFPATTIWPTFVWHEIWSPLQVVAIVAVTAFAIQPIEDAVRPTRDIRPLARVIRGIRRDGGAMVGAGVRGHGRQGPNSKRPPRRSRWLPIIPAHWKRPPALLNGILRDYPDDPDSGPCLGCVLRAGLRLGRAGPDARPFIDPVVKMTCRKIDVWAPPFGWSTLDVPVKFPGF